VEKSRSHSPSSAGNKSLLSNVSAERNPFSVKRLNCLFILAKHQRNEEPNSPSNSSIISVLDIVFPPKKEAKRSLAKPRGEENENIFLSKDARNGFRRVFSWQTGRHHRKSSADRGGEGDMHTFEDTNLSQMRFAMLLGANKQFISKQQIERKNRVS
jgi:hypothetical protein